MEREHYEALADLEEWHWWHLARQRILPAVLRRELGRGGKPAPLRILDVGCGTGKMTRVLQEFGSVVGVEMSPEAAATARDKGCPAIVVGRGGELPFADGQFDLVSAMEVIEHVEDDGALLADIKRVMKPGGLLYVTVPAYQFLWGPADVFAHHFRRYNRSALIRRLEQSGFRPRRVSYFSCLLFPAVAAIRLGRRPFVKLDQLSAEDLKDQFDFYIGPRFLNAPLRAIFGSEERLLKGIDLPFGSSLLAIAEAR